MTEESYKYICSECGETCIMYTGYHVNDDDSICCLECHAKAGDDKEI